MFNRLTIQPDSITYRALEMKKNICWLKPRMVLITLSVQIMADGIGNGLGPYREGCRSVVVIPAVLVCEFHSLDGVFVNTHEVA